MNMPIRGVRLAWLAGVILLLGTALGARWIIDQPASGTDRASPSDLAIFGIVGLGYADVPGGITNLHPLQSGRVEAVLINEGDEVKEGDMLLSLDNSLQKKNLDAAEAELAVARFAAQDLETQVPKKWQYEIEQQKARLEAARQELLVAEKELDIAKTAFIDDERKINQKRLDNLEYAVVGKKANVQGHEAALELLKVLNPQGTIDRARQEVKIKQAQRDLAHRALVECDLYAPADGSILRVFAQPGEVLTAQPRQAAVQLCGDAPRIIRMEVLQEWAANIKAGQAAVIEDDAHHGLTWKGKVERVGGLFTPRRLVLPEPFQFNDVRTLECIVALDPGSPPILINQRVRVKIK
jgi:multidrug resistance efflux pump